MQLTEHFADTELGVAGADPRLIQNASFLCLGVLEPLRLQFGPVAVHDGYRDLAHNLRVGGKLDSYHLFIGGQAAADISVTGEGCDAVFDWLRLESGLPFDKVILERNAQGFSATVHIQVDRLNAPRREPSASRQHWFSRARA